MTCTLVTIPISHYCDKARWALDRAGIDYREEGHAPILHFPAARKRKGTRTVPLLVHDQGVETDSTDILHWIDARVTPAQKLFPDEPDLRARVVASEERFDRSLGPAARRWAYFHVLPNARLATSLIGQGAPAHERAILRALFPLFAGLMRRGMNITAGKSAQSLEKIHQLFADVSGQLADGRRYLCGDRFTAADLTFAALAAPVLLPDEHPKMHAPWAEMPVAMRTEIAALRATSAGQFGLRLYREERTRY